MNTWNLVFKRKKGLGSFFWKRIVSKKTIFDLLSTNSHIRDKVKVVFKLSSYASKRELEHATGVDTSDLAAKNVLLHWKLKLIN